MVTSEGQLAVRRPTIIFVHIPKTAGTTLSRVIDRQYAPETRLALWDPSKAADELKALAPGDAARLRLVRGHFPFGLHAHIPRPCTYVTMLREPIARLVSHYYHLQNDTTHYLHEQGKNLSLEKYLLSDLSEELTNGQTQLIAGPGEGDSANQLERAKHNLLHHFSGIGISERFDESLILLGQRFGWKHLRYSKKRVGPSQRASLSESARKKVEARNAQDLELYRFCQKLLDASIRSGGQRLKLHVAAFRARNRVDAKIRERLEREGRNSRLG